MAHSDQRPENGIHEPFAAVYADAGTRAAATGFNGVAFDANDLYKAVLQLSDMSVWVLTNIVGPVWTQVGGAAGSSLVSPYNPNTKIIFTPTGGIQFLVNGQGWLDSEP